MAKQRKAEGTPPAEALTGPVSEAEELEGDEGGTLSERQEHFCHEYLVDLNGTRAVIRTPGYTENPGSAASQAWELLRMPKVQRRIRELKAETFHRLAVNRERVLEGLAELAFSDIGEIMDFDDATGVPGFRRVKDIPGHARRAIKKLKVKRVFPKGDGPADPHEIIEVDLHDRRAPLETLAKIEGMLEGEGDATVTAYVVVVPEKAASAEEWARQYVELPRRIGKTAALPPGSRRKPDLPAAKVKTRRKA